MTIDEKLLALSEGARFYMKNDCRKGQAYMNALYDIDKDLYCEITATPNDCFYVDSRFPSFMAVVVERWSSNG